MPHNLNEHGVQPLDQILNVLALKNHDLVASSDEQLTHKMVTKGRKGRHLSRNVQEKILHAINNAQNQRVFILEELFNYDQK